MSPKCLFIGMGDDSLPYLEYLRSQYEVITTDVDPDKGADYEVSYLDIPAMQSIAAEIGLTPEDRVFTAAAHHAQLTAASVCKDVGIPSISPVRVDMMLDKKKFYGLLDVMGIPYPMTYWLEAEEDDYVIPPGTYWVKSDYGKSPNYIQKVSLGLDGECDDGITWPDQADQYFHKYIAVQEHWEGQHVRVVTLQERMYYFLVFDMYSLFVPPDLFSDEARGQIFAGFTRVNQFLGNPRHCVKYDVLVNCEGGVVFLDCGLDPPYRLVRGIGDFESKYLDWQLGHAPDLRVTEGLIFHA